MSTTAGSENIIRAFEVKVFRYALFVSLAFRFIRTINELLTDSPLSIVLLGIFNLSLFILFFRFYRTHYPLILIFFYSQILITSVITWNNSGGWNGLVPYIFIVVIFGIVITSHGILQTAFLIAYGMILFLFGFTDLLSSFSAHNNNYSRSFMEMDFLMSVIILGLVTYYLKDNFLSYRESVDQTNKRLKDSSETLIAQTKKLHEQKAQLNKIRSNLESMISIKTSEAQDKADILKEYAFVNAHHVRGPLARVLGLIYLIELEDKGNPTSEALHKIKKDAQEMDNIIKKINEVIS